MRIYTDILLQEWDDAEVMAAAEGNRLLCAQKGMLWIALKLVNLQQHASVQGSRPRGGLKRRTFRCHHAKESEPKTKVK